MSQYYRFAIKDSLHTFLSSYGGHCRAHIQQARCSPCQEVLCKAHGESLQHQSVCTEVVNWLITAHYSNPLGTWVPFRALGAVGVGWERGTARKNRITKRVKKKGKPGFCLAGDEVEDRWTSRKNDSNHDVTVLCQARKVVSENCSCWSQIMIKSMAIQATQKNASLSNLWSIQPDHANLHI